MSDGGITMKTQHGWSRADAMTEAQVHAAAVADPDAQPSTAEPLSVI
jgi:putative transcriptional regulator